MLKKNPGNCCNVIPCTADSKNTHWYPGKSYHWMSTKADKLQTLTYINTKFCLIMAEIDTSLLYSKPYLFLALQYTFWFPTSSTIVSSANILKFNTHFNFMQSLSEGSFYCHKITRYDWSNYLKENKNIWDWCITKLISFVSAFRVTQRNKYYRPTPT